MTAHPEPAPTSRRRRNAELRMSRRPSRLGRFAGAAPEPDYLLAEDAGFPGLLKTVWDEACAAPDLAGVIQTLLTLGGHVPADVQLRALGTAEETALTVLTGASWRDGLGPEPRPLGSLDKPAFRGEIGLTTSGRIAIRVPSQGSLAATESLVQGEVLRVPWSSRALADYQGLMADAADRFTQSVADCRQWLEDQRPPGREELLEELKQAALRTAPFILYQERKQYTNFRDLNSITGKTLWPGHPDCALSSLQGIPLRLWSDSDVLMVVCLTLLVRSAGYQRIEEANGTQLSVDHVAHLLEQVRVRYDEVPGTQPIPPAPAPDVVALDQLARALGRRRLELMPSARLYREIHGALLHKIERIAGPFAGQAREREAALCAELRAGLPFDGETLEELGEGIAAGPEWLTRPHGGFGTGLESLVHATVSGTNRAFDADFSMSRGMRSLPELVAALRREDWAAIAQWDITSFFCCVVPASTALAYFDDSRRRLADASWAISSRMQYNSWHFIAGNLPKVPAVEARDYFVPPSIPDLAFYSDQHHHGHVAAKVRFTVRSPQPVWVLGRRFGGFVDLRLQRCEGRPFDEQDLLVAQRASGLIARVTTLVAELAAEQTPVEVTAFDSRWHWTTIAEQSLIEAPADAVERP